MAETKIIRAQKGFQDKFTTTNVDFVIGGGVLNPIPIDRMVASPKGFVRMGDIKQGDVVLRPNGGTQIVNIVIDRGYRECVEFVLENGFTVESDLEHNWQITIDGVKYERVTAKYIVDNHKYNIRIPSKYNGNLLVKDIRFTGKKHCKCINVSGDEHTFFTDNYVITCNCGKAQPLYSKIMTPNGFVTMGSIKVGDIISDKDGGFQKVEHVFERGFLNDYKVVFDDGTSVECCDQHLWYVFDTINKRYEVKELSEILSNGFKRYLVPLCGNIEYNCEKEELPIEPYLLGVLLGSGRIYKNKQNTINITTDIENIHRAYSRKQFEYVCNNIENECNNIEITDKNIIKNIDALCLEGTSSYNKFIPDIYKKSSVENRLELLRGLIDSNLCIDKRSFSIEYTTKSKKLKDDVCYIARSLGAKVSVIENVGYYVKNGNKEICYRDYRLSIMHDDLFSFFTTKLEKTERKEVEKIYKRIECVEYCGKQEMRCIVVSGKEHLYVTDGFTVTHNSFSAVLSVAEPSLDPNFRGLFLRNNLGDARASGGLLDTFKECYGNYIKVVESGEPRVEFPSGAKIDVTHVSDQSRDKIMQRFKGRQYDFIYFDEGTGFTWECFTSIYSRNRGTAKWTGHVMMTTNPERDHWLRKFLDWYIGSDGFIREDRNGVVRYFYINGDDVKDVVWGNTKFEVYNKCRIDIDRKLAKINGKDGNASWEDMIKSFTFYLGRMSENKASIGKNGGYVGSVAITGGKTAQQLLEGNWNVSSKDNDMQEISMEDANAVFVSDPQTNGDRWVTCDLADTGTDNFIALAWDGFHIEDILILNKTTPRDNAEYLRIFAEEHDVADNHIIYDAVRGTYINDYIPDAVQFISYRAPRGLYGRMAQKLKDECYMRLIEAIKRHNFSMSDKVSEKIYEHAKLKEKISVANEFIEECSVVRFREMNSGKKTLYSKKEMNAALGKSRSMDLLDPCAMRMMPCLDYAYGDELARTVRILSEDEERGYSPNEVDIYDDHTWY